MGLEVGVGQGGDRGSHLAFLKPGKRETWVHLREI